MSMSSQSSIVHELDVSNVERDLNALLQRTGHKGARQTPVDIASITLPSTQITEAATAAAKKCLDQAIFNHSVRVYYISQILKHDHFPTWQVDNELLYTVCILHDMGCADEHQLHTPISFELHGALLARDIVKAAGGSELQACRVAEAINKHEGFPHRGYQYTLDACIEFSTTCDALGMLPNTLYTEKQIDDLATAYPRLGFNHRFRECMEREVRLKPGCFASTYITDDVLNGIQCNRVYAKHDKH